MTPVVSSERRRSARYIVGGQVIFYTGSPDFSGVLVNIGRHGMLVRTNVRVPEGTRFQIGFTVSGYPSPLQGHSQVVGGIADLLAMEFFGEPGELSQLLQWLDRENVPWTGLDPPRNAHAVRPLVASKSDPASSETKEINQELEAVLPFLEAMG